MNFFNQLNALAGICEMNLVFKKISGDRISVIITPKPDVKDEAFTSLQPIVMTGTPEELDEGFFAHLAQPMEKLNGIVSNVASFEKDVEDKKSKTAAGKKEKEAADKAAKKEADKAVKEAEAKKKKAAPIFEKVKAAIKEKDDLKALDLVKQVLELDPEHKQGLTKKSQIEGRLEKAGQLPKEETSEDLKVQEQKCRVCGCTQDNCEQCIEKTGQPCTWVEKDLCSACTESVTNEDEPASAEPAKEEPNIKDLIFQAQEAQAKGEYEESERLWKKAVVIDPKSKTIQKGLAEAQMWIRAKQRQEEESAQEEAAPEKAEEPAETADVTTEPSFDIAESAEAEQDAEVIEFDLRSRPAAQPAQDDDFELSFD